MRDMKNRIDSEYCYLVMLLCVIFGVHIFHLLFEVFRCCVLYMLVLSGLCSL